MIGLGSDKNMQSKGFDIFQTSVMAAEIESGGHGEKPVYRKMAEYKKKISLVEVSR